MLDAPWLKAFHTIFMVTWFAGLFYLPRLFVYHAQCEDIPGHERFCVMERKLYVITSIGAVATIALGGWMLAVYAWAAYGGAWWLQAKLAFVAVLVVFHLYCARVVRAFREGQNRHGHRFFRWLNEVPAVLLIAIVVLAVVKPT